MRLAVVPGDGIGPEVVGEALKVLSEVAPQIESTDPGVEVLARLGSSPVAIAQGRHLGLTFHPEMTGDDRLHRLFLERIGRRAEDAA